MHLAEFQSIYHQQTSDRLFDSQHVDHELLARDQCRAQEQCLSALHAHWPIVTEAHHIGDPASVAAVGLDRPRRQEPLRVARLNADRGEAGVDQGAVEPFRASAFINDAGSLSALPSQTTVPSVLTMQIDTVFSDTSNPTKSAIALLPLLLGRINPSSRGAGGRDRNTPAGVLFAYALAVNADVAIGRLCIRDTFGECVEITGERD